MGTIDDYLDDLDPADRAVIAHVYDVVRSELGDLEQGKSYGMPALLYRGKALISVMRTRKHIGVYPYSGRVPRSSPRPSRISTTTRARSASSPTGRSRTPPSAPSSPRGSPRSRTRRCGVERPPDREPTRVIPRTRSTHDAGRANPVMPVLPHNVG